MRSRGIQTLTILLFAFVSCFLSSFLHLNDDAVETLRHRIENSYTQKLMAGDELIHCVQSLPRFYENRIFKPVWTSPKQVNALILSLKEAGNEGLQPQDYHLNKIMELNKNYSNLLTAQMVDLELLATDAFLLYTSHLLSGKINPETIDPEWYVTRSEGDPVSLFEKAVSQSNISGMLREVLPKHTVYQSLKEALKRYNDIQKKGGWTIIAGGETLKMGMLNNRIALVKQRLIASEDLAMIGSDKDEFDDDLLEAVKRFQSRHGLDVDGEIGKMTVAAMNVPVEDRIKQILVNMERWRWLPREYSNYYVKVNIADFTLAIVKNGKVERMHNVIVGKNYRRTPVFSSKITYLVLNPTWTIPPGILNADILPAVRKNVSYLKTKNIIVYNSAGQVIDPSTIDWSSPSVKAYTYRQPPGTDNALGAVKFMFPNKFNVYIHDTPSKELFEKAERSFSSGCIRVQDPLQMAEYLINDNANWGMDKIMNHVSTKKTETIPLKEQPDVHILYWTAWTNENGLVQFRKDVYERDKAVEKGLNSLPPAL